MSFLAEIIDAIQPGRKLRCHSEPSRAPMCHVWVHFYGESGEEIAGLELPKAMDCLINDVWHFEDFDLTEAHSVEVQIH